MRQAKSLPDRIIGNIRNAGIAGDIRVRDGAYPGFVRPSGVVTAALDRVPADEAARFTPGLLEVCNELFISGKI